MENDRTIKPGDWRRYAEAIGLATCSLRNDCQTERIIGGITRAGWATRFPVFDVSF